MRFKASIPTNLKIKRDSNSDERVTYNNLIFKCMEIAIEFSKKFDNIKIQTYNHSVKFMGKDGMRVHFEHIELRFHTYSWYLNVELEGDFDKDESFNEICDKMVDVIDLLGLKSE